MKLKHFIVVLTLMVGMTGRLYSQVFYIDFPKQNHIYQRDATDSATVHVSGNFNTLGTKTIVFKVLRDGVFVNSVSYAPPTEGHTIFTVPIRLKAGRFKYTIEAHQDNPNYFKSSSDILVGDVFVFYGQSNAIGLGNEINTYAPPTDDEYMRTFYTNEDYTYGEFEKMDGLSAFKVGMFPIEVMKQYRLKSNYPVGVVQAAISGMNLEALSHRNEGNPYDINSFYGQLLTKLKLAHLKNYVKYIAFRQGENEGASETTTAEYPKRFQKLMENCEKDLSTLSHFFNFQLNIVSTTYSNNIHMEDLRDFQRRTEDLYPKVRSIACAGITEYDGVHFRPLGHAKAANSMMGILAKEVWGLTNAKDVCSPNIKKAFYNPDRTEIKLVFNEGIRMVYPADSSYTDLNGNSVTSRMRDEFFIDGNNSIVTGGRAEGNSIILSIPQATNNQSITYLRNLATPNYVGVSLKTFLGERALTFAKYPVASALLQPVIQAQVNGSSIQLNWNSVPDANVYILEKRIMGQPTFSPLKNLQGLDYVDTDIVSGNTYEYRIMAISPQSESGFSAVQSVNYTLVLKNNCPENLMCIFDIKIKRNPSKHH